LRSITRLAVALVLAASATPAGAGGYEVHRYSYEIGTASHRPKVADVFGDLLGLPAYHGAPVGTPQNPAPVCPPAVVYHVQRGPLYNGPPSPTDTYRVISDCN
jgi:hypothetical protein